MDDKFYDNKVKGMSLENVIKSHAVNGASFVSLTGSIGPNDYYGILIGDTVPVTITVTFGKYAALYDIDGTTPTGGQQVAISGSYFNAGEYVPIMFTNMSVTGTGYVKAFKK